MARVAGRWGFEVEARDTAVIFRPTIWIDCYSSVSGPTPRLGVVVLIVSYSVTRTTPGTGSSITSMIVSSTTGTFCPGAFLGANFALDFRGRFSGLARFAAFLREGLALAFPRFEAFLRVATRFVALAMAVSSKVCRRAIRLSQHYPSAIGHATFIDFRWVKPGKLLCGEFPRCIFLAESGDVSLQPKNQH